MEPGDKVRFQDAVTSGETIFTVVAIDYPQKGSVCVETPDGERWYVHPDEFEVVT